MGAPRKQTRRMPYDRYLRTLDAHGEYWLSGIPICARCQRLATGWLLKRADVCAPADWAKCIRNLSQHVRVI